MKEILEIRGQIYILLKKSIILRKKEVTNKHSPHHFSTVSVLTGPGKKRVVLRAMRKKLNIHTSAAHLLHIRVVNLDGCKCRHCKNEA